MAIHDRVSQIRQTRIARHGQAVPSQLQGVSKDKVRRVLGRLNLGNNADVVDAVFALLDDETESWFSRCPAGARFSDGATTAHIACHVGILQRGNGKLDREGRDYWIKPLRELGGIEAITLHNGEFIAGHAKAKSSNSCYRLDSGLKEILLSSEQEWPLLLAKWSDEDAERARRAFHSSAAEAAKALVDDGHSALIQTSVDVYAKQFLPGYKVIYRDEGDGDRITATDKARLLEAGIELTLGDAMPDALLWNAKEDSLWVIEAVTSDGEVDLHKVTQLTKLANRCGKRKVQFTTTYRSWKEAASRQGAHQNVAVGTYIWIASDPAKQFLVQSFN